MTTLTILTPAYNRADCLEKLYESLKAQSTKDFNWLLVDDGSSDRTSLLAEDWEKNAPFAFRYLKKENGGKHTALNLGIAEIKTELTFIVDSDDWLPTDAVEIILRYHEKYREMSGLCGYSFLRFYPDGRVNEAFFPEDEKVDTYVNARINGGIGGDKAEVFYTDVLKQFPFPVYEGEKFVPEDLIWVRMSGPYRMVHINQCVYISEYLEGGLTKSGRRMKLKSPVGMMERALVYLQDPAVNRKTKVKMMLLYQIYGRKAGKKTGALWKKVPEKMLFFICILPAGLMGAIWKRRYCVLQSICER